MPHTPIRMCVVCRQRLAKVELMRHVITTENTWLLDEKHRLPGRGYYVCTQEACKEKFFHYKTGLKRRKGVQSDKR